ncbi:MAG: MBL fold metallo-hydrolase [Pseudomonadota bacterium]
MTLRKPLAIGLALCLGIMAFGTWWFQAPLGERIYARAVSQRVGGDATMGLPDGLHLILCGTGSPLPDTNRAGPCAAIIAGRQIYIVDIGEGASRTLSAAQVPLGRVNGLFLTHFHSDHFDGIGPLMLLRWTQGTATSPLPVYGPYGVAALVDGFNAAYATDNGYRVAHHGPAIVPPTGAGAQAMPFATPPADGSPVTVLRRDGLVVTAFRVNHGPVSPAVGYRFTYKGRSVVISGDSAATPAMAHNAADADILLHDALQPALLGHITNGLAARGQGNTAQITRDIVNYHATPSDAARAAKGAGVRHLVLTHLVPMMPSSYFYQAFLGDAAAQYSGPIIVGEDGMIFTLPANSTAITQGQLL